MLLKRPKSLRAAHAVSLCGTTGQPSGEGHLLFTPIDKRMLELGLCFILVLL